MTTRRPALILLATCLGLFVGQLDTTAVNLALPAMGRDLGGAIAGQQWIVDAYNLAFAALLLTGGTLGDRFGRRRMFVIGASSFLTGSVICALAPNLATVVVGRAVQGGGAAMMLPQSLAIIAVAFPERSERNRAMSVWSAVAAIGLAAGPTVGGVMVDLFGWSSIFWVNVPVCAAAVSLALRYVPETEDPNARRLDPAGQFLAIVLLASLTFAVVEGQRQGWTSALILTSGVVALGCLAAFLAVEQRSAQPMLPLGLVRRGQLPVAAVVAACMTFGMYGMFMLASLNLQQDRGAAPIVAGLQMLPLPVVFALVSPYTGRLVTRIGPRLPMTAGLSLMGFGLVAYAALGAHANLLLLELAFMVIGLGLALNTGPVVAVAVSAVDADRAGLASGVANLARMFGAALGVAVMGTVLAVVGDGAHSGPGFVTGLRAALLVGAAVELAGAAVCLRKIRNPGDRPVAPRAREPEPATQR